MADLLSMTDKKNADKQKALESALSQIERQFGKGSIMKLGSENAIQEIEATSTGICRKKQCSRILKGYSLLGHTMNKETMYPHP